MTKAPPFQLSFFLPKYWLMWVLIIFMWLITWLPLSFQMALGKGLGLLVHKFLKSRRHIAERNIELCFPEMPKAERDALVRENFINSGRALLESSMGWWWPNWRVAKVAKFEGYEHIQNTLDKGKGVLLLAPHVLHLDMACRVFGLTHPSVGFYRPHNNPLMEYFQYRGRCRSNKYMVGKRDVKGMIRALRNKEVCFYLPDQDYGPNRSIFAPFFAVEETASTTGTLMFAKMADCDVIPVLTNRSKDNKTYDVVALPPLENFPSGDDIADVTRVNQWVEQVVNRDKSQYLWMHRRFKTRPEHDKTNLYKKK